MSRIKARKYLITVKFQPVTDNHILKKTQEIHVLQTVATIHFPLNYDKFFKEYVNALFHPILSNINKNDKF